MSAVVAVCASESVRENPALQIRAKLVLHILGKATLVMFVRVGKKAREVLAHDPVERALLGTTGRISRRKSGQGPQHTAGPVPKRADVVSTTLRGGSGVRDDFMVSEDRRDRRLVNP